MGREEIGQPPPPPSPSLPLPVAHQFEWPAIRVYVACAVRACKRGVFRQARTFLCEVARAQTSQRQASKGQIGGGLSHGWSVLCDWSRSGRSPVDRAAPPGVHFLAQGQLLRCSLCSAGALGSLGAKWDAQFGLVCSRLWCVGSRMLKLFFCLFLSHVAVVVVQSLRALIGIAESCACSEERIGPREELACYQGGCSFLSHGNSRWNFSV